MQIGYLLQVNFISTCEKDTMTLERIFTCGFFFFQVNSHVWKVFSLNNSCRSADTAFAASQMSCQCCFFITDTQSCLCHSICKQHLPLCCFLRDVTYANNKLSAIHLQLMIEGIHHPSVFEPYFSYIFSVRKYKRRLLREAHCFSVVL